MGFSPLAQGLTIAVLAYASGLLLGLSIYRGEIGPRRPPAHRRARTRVATDFSTPRPERLPFPDSAPHHEPSLRRESSSRPERRPSTPMRKLRRTLQDISDNARRYAFAIVLLTVLILFALGGVTLVLAAYSKPLDPLF
jgi:hypothetical protein